MNDDLAARFADEAHAHLSAATELLLRLEHDPAGASLSELQRHLHSVKGAASALGLQAGVRLAHALEDVVAERAAGRVPLTGETTDTLLAAADTLATVLNLVEADAAPPVEISRTLASLEQLLPRAAALGVISPDLAGVLSVYQVFRVRQAFERGMHLFEISVDVPAGGFGDVSGRCEDAARGRIVIARTGGSRVPYGSDAVYLMLLAAPEAQSAVAEAFHDVGARVREVAPDQLPAAAVLRPAADRADVDADLRALRTVFLSSSAERVAQIAQDLVRLETEAHPQETLDQVFRIVHNLKGGGATFGLASVSAVAHAMEEILDRLRSDGAAIAPDRISALLHGADALQRLLHETNAQAAARLTEEALRALRGPTEAGGTAPTPILRANKGETRPRVAADSVRVPLARLNELVNAVSELHGGQAALEQHCRAVEQMREGFRTTRRVIETLLPSAPDASSHAAGSLQALDERLRVLNDALDALSRRTNRTLEALQETVLRARMVPVQRLFAVAPRLVRDLARAQGKQVQLLTEGEDVEVDKQILEELEDPLVHLLRNAIDHGLEVPARREASGKPAAGTVRLAATQAGARVEITISDDGDGIEPARMRDLAVARGVIDAAEAAALDDAGAIRLIFHPGFSSRERVSELSGRGVGLDVVARNIERLQGEVQVASVPGGGTTFTIAVPLTLALSTVLYVEAAGQTVALPLRDVQATRLVAPGDLRQVGTRTVLRVEGGVIDAVPLALLLGSASRGEAAPPAPSAGRVALIVSSMGARQALLADRVYEGERVVIKALGDLVGSLPVIRGATIRADGDPVVVLDGAALAAASRSTSWSQPAEPKTPAPSAQTVMIVDDSPATIELLSGILRAAGYTVAAALSGDEALAQLEHLRPHAIIADVQMPGIDGFELTRRIKASAAWRDIPVVILSSLSTEADRRRGLEAGADAYAVKSGFDADSLLGHVDRLVAARSRS